MTVLVIRAHKRFAVRRQAHLGKTGERAMNGLLIELSLEGCRLSNIDDRKFAVDEVVTVDIDGVEPMEGRVRWLNDRTLGLRFVAPLHIAALDRLIRFCRGEIDDDGTPLRLYG